MGVENCEFFQNHDKGVGMALIEPGGFKNMNPMEMTWKDEGGLPNICHGYSKQVFDGYEYDWYGQRKWHPGQIACPTCFGDDKES